MLSTLFSILNNHWIFDQKRLKIPILIYLSNELALANLSALIDKESHDSFGHLVTDGLLDNSKVAVNQILNHPGLHNYSGALLVVGRAHRCRDLLKHHIFEVMSRIIHVATNVRVIFVTSGNIGCTDALNGQISTIDVIFVLLMLSVVLIIAIDVLEHAIFQLLVGI